MYQWGTPLINQDSITKNKRKNDPIPITKILPFILQFLLCQDFRFFCLDWGKSFWMIPTFFASQWLCGSSSRSGWTPVAHIGQGICFCRCRSARWWWRFDASFDGLSIRWIQSERLRGRRSSPCALLFVALAWRQFLGAWLDHWRHQRLPLCGCVVDDAYCCVNKACKCFDRP